MVLGKLILFGHAHFLLEAYSWQSTLGSFLGCLGCLGYNTGCPVSNLGCLHVNQHPIHYTVSVVCKSHFGHYKLPHALDFICYLLIINSLLFCWFLKKYTCRQCSRIIFLLLTEIWFVFPLEKVVNICIVNLRYIFIVLFFLFPTISRNDLK